MCPDYDTARPRVLQSGGLLGATGAPTLRTRASRGLHSGRPPNQTAAQLGVGPRWLVRSVSSANA
eukprot:scaffold99941_cov61-Phaeocystis_antarctica.AAC.10